jgi:hypothetical protein
MVLIVPFLSEATHVRKPALYRVGPVQEGSKEERTLDMRQQVNAHLEVPANKEFATHLGRSGWIFRVWKKRRLQYRDASAWEVEVVWPV